MEPSGDNAGVPQTFLSSGRACLVRWERVLELADIHALLASLGRARAEAGAPLVAVWVVTRSAEVPSFRTRNALVGAQPALLSHCEALIVALECVQDHRPLLRALFFGPPAVTPPARLPEVFDDAEAAFARARKFAAHDVIALQRLFLRHQEQR
jgi:hypothetical protein